MRSRMERSFVCLRVVAIWVVAISLLNSTDGIIDATGAE